MDYAKLEGPDGLEIRIPTDESYRTCSEYGGEYVPRADRADSLGIRVAFVRPEQGVHGIVDPFEDLR